MEKNKQCQECGSLVDGPEFDRREKRRAAQESEHSLMQEVIDEVIFNQNCNWCRKKQLHEATLRLGQFRLDALTPDPKEKTFESQSNKRKAGQ